MHDRLTQLGLTLPEASAAPGTFVGARRTDNTISVSGQVPLRDGAVVAAGRLGEAVSLELGRECAEQALLNCLAQLAAVAGSLDDVAGFIRLGGYVAATPDFTQHGKVIDAASELLCALFPDRWQHARIALGVACLPRGVPVEIELSAILVDKV